MEKSQYLISSVVLTLTENATSADDCKTIDITTLVTDIQLFEDITLAYVTGIVMIGDPQAALSRFDLTHGVKINITLKSTVSVDGKEISKDFLIYDIIAKDQKRTMQTFRIIEEHGHKYISNQSQKSYKGKLEHILQNILFEELNQKGLDDFNSEESIEPEVVINIPNVSLSEFVPKIVQSMCTAEKGSPYFLYATLYDNENIKLSSYTQLVANGSFNCRPFIYSPKLQDTAEEDRDVDLQYYKIIDFNPDHSKSYSKQVQEGIANSDIYMINISSGKSTIEETTIQEENSYLKNLYPNGTVENLDTTTTASEFTLSGMPFSQSKTNVFLMYDPPADGQHTLLNCNHEEGVRKLHVHSKQLKKTLAQSLITATVPGAVLFESEAGVGSMIDIRIMRTDTTKTDNDWSFNDELLSGKYLITHAKHTFSNGEHKVDLNIGKLIVEK